MSCKMVYLDNPSCCYCETPFELYSVRTREHMIPLSRGGKVGYPNKASCCDRCNKTKGNMLPSEFLKKIEAAYYILKNKWGRIDVNEMPTIMKNLKTIITKVENNPDYLNPTAKKLFVCGN